ncbi:carbohydrate ABC transporter permease [soil metagenome]
MISGQGNRRSRAEVILTSGLLIVAIVMFGGPFLWILASAFASSDTGPTLWPGVPSLDNFRAVFNEQETGLALRSSLIVAGACMMLGTLLASLGGFGLSRVSIPGKDAIVFGLLLLYAIPTAVTMVALFDLASKMELVDTYRGLILAQTAVSLPFLTWLMKSFYDKVPRMLDEAVTVDGRGILRAWLDVLTPVAKPGLAITAGLAFVLAWSEVLLTIVLISDPDKITIARLFFINAERAASSQVTTALAALYLGPVLVVFLLLRGLIARHLARLRGSR